MKIEETNGNLDLKTAFERELKRLGHLPPEKEGIDFHALIIQLADTEVVGKTFARNELQKAYRMAVMRIDKQADAEENVFLQNIFLVLIGIPAPTRWASGLKGRVHAHGSKRKFLQRDAEHN